METKNSTKEITMETKTIETWLPLFPGFYNTMFDPGEELYNTIENDISCGYYVLGDGTIIRQDDDYNIDDIADIDYAGYMNSVAKVYTEAIESVLVENGVVSSIKYEKVVSPRYYNYGNDSIDIAVELTEENSKKIQKYILDNQEEFEEMLERKYKCRDGFIPSYSHHIIDWIDETDNFLMNENNTHELGMILEFILYIIDRNINNEIGLIVWENTYIYEFIEYKEGVEYKDYPYEDVNQK